MFIVVDALPPMRGVVLMSIAVYLELTEPSRINREYPHSSAYPIKGGDM